MKIDEYQIISNRTRNMKLSTNMELTNYALGMVCEAGETGDILKKYIYHNHDLDRDGLIKELGDTMWYMVNICNMLDISMEEVLDKNIDKLNKRYPKGYDNGSSKNRAEYNTGCDM